MTLKALEKIARKRDYFELLDSTMEFATKAINKLFADLGRKRPVNEIDANMGLKLIWEKITQRMIESGHEPADLTKAIPAIAAWAGKPVEPT